ncbi:Uncharacterised protein [Mycobacteroides abscessus subsp. abscessus]|nr:Uncharacterised protein [Mycobacteroides abscessus subsp. abscessus]
MTEEHRQGPRAVAVDNGEVGVADPGGGEPDADLAGARVVEVERFDRQRPRVGIGLRAPHLPQHRPLDPHDRPLTPALAPAMFTARPDRRPRRRP